VRILVDVASDRLRAELVELLERAGHTIEYGEASRTRPFDLALVGTPEQAAKLKHERPHDAVIVVTKAGDIPARVRALEVGADDAIDSSFPMAQSMARIGAAGRRAAAMPRMSEQLTIDGCTIDLSAATAERDGTRMPLTVREVELIRWFVRHLGRVVSRAELLQNVWRMAAGSETRAVDVAIVGLRQKIERDPAEPQIIVSVRGAGYRWG
jgi:two-component system, OmpR family, response regulator ResD